MKKCVSSEENSEDKSIWNSGRSIEVKHYGIATCSSNVVAIA
jgi:hypothetical protein